MAYRTRLPEHFLAQLRDRVNLLDVASDYTTLTPAGGARHKGLCPFHSEHTPSFMVSSDTHRYHCFGCDADGDAISLLTELGGMTFREAVADLAARVGLTVPTTSDDGRPDPRVTARRALTACQPLLHRWLMDDPAADAARQFLRERGFSRTHATEWELGFQPRHTRLSAAAHMPGGDLAQAGMTAEGRHGTYDVFAGRLVWPLRDATGQLIGYAGRDLEGMSQAKYINTRDTVLYRKHDTVFGLHRARRSMLRHRQVFVVEGYTDVMAMVAAGIDNTVATCGTAVTDRHAEQLHARIGDGGEVVCVFDNDDAGRAAAWRAFMAVQRFTSAVTVVALDDAGIKGDPCDVRQRSGDEALVAAAQSRSPLLASVIRADIADCDTTTPEGKTGARDAVVRRLRQVRDPVLVREYAQLAARWIGVEVSDFGALSGRPGTVSPPSGHPAPRISESAPDAADAGRGADDTVSRVHPPAESALTIAATLMARPVLVEAAAWFGGGRVAGLVGDALAEIIENSIALFPGGRPPAGTDEAHLWVDTLMEVLGPPLHALISVAAMTEPCDGTNLEELMSRVARLRCRQRLGELHDLLDGADGAGLAELLSEYGRLQQHLKTLAT